ncbi:MAG: energy transducer TonB [Rhodanobacteraceae bacterium]
MSRLYAILLCLLLPAVCLAATESEVKRTTEATMLVTGSIVVNPDGSVHTYTLEQPDKLSSGVTQLLAQYVPKWRFEATRLVDQNNHPALAKAAMNVRLVLTEVSKDRYQLGIVGATFGADQQDPKDISWKSRVVPTYPREAVDDGVSGTVYLVVKVGQSGNVINAAVKQVDLRVVANSGAMQAYRRVLGDAALRAAQHWTFNVPQPLPGGNVRVPVNFSISGLDKLVVYGEWQAYIPGPVEPVSWLDSDDKLANSSPDAIPDNGLLFMNNERLVLQNPPSGG